MPMEIQINEYEQKCEYEQWAKVIFNDNLKEKNINQTDASH